jgi:uncharacterized membrane protein YkvA (DUF1232 family)
MIHRTASGQAIGSSGPRSQVIDPGCWPDTSQTSSWSKKKTLESSQSERIKSEQFKSEQSRFSLIQSPGKLLSQRSSEDCQLESLPIFPRTLFSFKTYDGGKALTAILFLLATIYFLAGFIGFVCDHTPWLKQLLQPTVITPVAPQALWWQIWKPIGGMVGGVATQIASYVDLVFRLFVFLCTYCLAWATFDTRNIEGYIMGFFNTCLGLAYLVSPIDVIPDFIPVAGGIDDAILGIGVLLLGMSSLYRNKLRDVKTNTIVELIDGGNRQKALQMLLEDKGIRIKDQNSNVQP